MLLTNISASPLQRASMGLVFDALLNELLAAADPTNPIDLQPYVGRYIANFGPFDNADFTVTAEGNTLYVDVPDQTKFELRPPNEQRRWVFAVTDTIEQVSPMLGLYHSETPAPDITIRMDGGRLIADVEGQMAFVLRTPNEDGRWQFRAKNDIAVSFREDAKGSIDALILHQGGADLPLLRTAPAKAKPLPSLAKLLETAKAKAFTRRLEQLGAIEITGKVRMPSSNIEGRFRVVFDHERRQRLELDLGRYGRVIETYDGNSAWTVSTLSPPSEAQGKYLRQAQRSSPFLVGDWTQGFDEARVDSRVGEGKAERVIVVLRAEGLPPQVLRRPQDRRRDLDRANAPIRGHRTRPQQDRAE